MYGSVKKPSDEDSKIFPSSPYAASKVAFDMYLKSVNKFLGFKMNIVRPSNAYCSGQLLHRIIPRSFVSILKGEKFLFTVEERRKNHICMLLIWLKQYI